MTRLVVVLVATAAAVWLEPSDARACGAAFWSATETSPVALDGQRTLLVYHGTHVRHYVQVSYSGNPKEFGWIYPLPANPEPLESVPDGDELFKILDEKTRPVFHIEVHDEGGGCTLGCGAALDAAYPGADSDGGTRVTVWDRGQVGIFEYVVITAETVDPLRTWLVSNGFRIPPGVEPVLEHYVTSGFYFVAMKVNPEEAGVVGEASTSTILFRYTTTRRIYPLYMASIGAAEKTSVLLYVLATNRVEVSPYATVTIDRERVRVVGEAPPFSVNYEEVFEQTLAEAGGRAFVTEYAEWAPDFRTWSRSLADLPPSFSPILTRLVTTMGPSKMSDDVEIRNAPTNESVSRDFWLVAYVGGGSSSAAFDLLVGLAAPALLVLANRRKTR